MNRCAIPCRDLGGGREASAEEIQPNTYKFHHGDDTEARVVFSSLALTVIYSMEETIPADIARLHQWIACRDAWLVMSDLELDGDGIYLPHDSI